MQSLNRKNTPPILFFVFQRVIICKSADFSSEFVKNYPKFEITKQSSLKKSIFEVKIFFVMYCK